MVSPSTQVPTTTHVPTPPATPTSLSTSAHDLLHSIRGIYQDLRHLSDLSPGEKVNGLLTQLVGLCIQPYGSEFTSYFLGIDGVDVLCTKLQALCGTAEGELEKYWARRIVGDASLKEGKGMLAICCYVSTSYRLFLGEIFWLLVGNIQRTLTCTLTQQHKII
jgi:hypothetical protein